MYDVSHMTASSLLWQSAGQPQSKWGSVPCSGFCATCGLAITAGISVDSIVSVSFSAHADYLRFGSHVCEACAWLYAFPKENHRNVLAMEGHPIVWPMISHDSATSVRPSWYDVLHQVSRLPHETTLAGVLTTDPKPRFWPRTKVATVGQFGVYVHCPDYDLSTFLSFSLASALAIATLCCEVLALGYSKRSLYCGLWRDYERLKQYGERVAVYEAQLVTLRRSPAFIPALLIAGHKKGNV